jgi:hypothetical protein
MGDAPDSPPRVARVRDSRATNAASMTTKHANQQI